MLGSRERTKSRLEYHGLDKKRNGRGVMLKQEYAMNVLGGETVSDRVMCV